MKDVSDKIETKRQAVALATLRASPDAIAAAKSGATPKGAVWDIARAAGIIAAKKTYELIPYCHPIPIDHIAIDFDASEAEIKITASVRAIGKTGVEMEALTAVTVATLTVYDMLKPIDDNLMICDVSLLEKKGGKSDFREKSVPTAAVLVTSDSVSSGKKDDTSGRAIVDRLKSHGADVKSYVVIPDNAEQITRTVKAWVSEGIGLIITTGGTGLGPRDVTVDALAKIIERDVPGVAEAMRTYGQRRTPYAMLSRGLCGVIDKSVVVALPGSSRGVKESLDAILPHLFHIYPMIEGGGH